jgi:hypothetical protein
MRTIYFLLAILFIIAFNSCSKKVAHDSDYRADSTVYFAEKNHTSEYREDNQGVFFITQKGTPVYFASNGVRDQDFKKIFLAGSLRGDSIIFIRDEYVFHSKIFADEVKDSSIIVEKKIPVKDKDGFLTVGVDVRNSYQWIEGVKILQGKPDNEVDSLDEELPKLFGITPSEDFKKDDEPWIRGTYYMAVHNIIGIGIIQGKTVKEAIVSYTKEFTKDFLPDDPKDWNPDEFPGVYE